MAALLEARGLTVTYGRFRALHGADLIVPEGRVAGLIGSNGAGKTTLLRTVAGLVAPSSGAVFLQGERIDGLPASAIARRGVCLTPEGRGIFGALTVAENLRIALGDDERARGRVLAHFPVLGERLEQTAGTLSGGEQQMLALARAIGRNAPLLMFDEPSLGLAPKIVKEIAVTIEQLSVEGQRTILLVEQHVTHVLRLADVVYVLERGRIVWAGEPSELRASRVLSETYLGAGA